MTDKPVYYVIAKADNGDEWVIPETSDTYEGAEVTRQLMQAGKPEYTYRVEKTESRGKAKLIANSLYGKISPVLRQRQAEELGFTIPELTTPPVQPQRADFTDLELFPQLRDSKSVAYTLTCTECACEVKNTVITLKRHAAWHNKLLP